MDFFSFLAGSAEMFYSFSLGEDLTTDQLTSYYVHSYAG